jgi:hypothetical protein
VSRHESDEESLIGRLRVGGSGLERVKERDRKNSTAGTQQEVAATQLADRH